MSAHQEYIKLGNPNILSIPDYLYSTREEGGGVKYEQIPHVMKRATLGIFQVVKLITRIIWREQNNNKVNNVF